MITLYSKDGQVKVEKIKKFSYSGKFMGECFITAPFAFSDILNFNIGDYVMFRDEKFELNYIPAKKKQASKGSYGKAFEYDNVKFNSLADELTRIEFIDVVKHDNNISYSSQPTFSFYANSVHDLVDRIQANLDLEFKDDKKWTIVVSEDIVSPSKNISVSNISVADAVVLINTEFGLNFTFKNRTLTIGESGLAVGKVFAYGKDNGLFDIQQTTNQDAKIITRLRAFGSTRNIPRRYYNNLKDEQGKPYILESDDIKNLMLPSFPYEESDPRKLYLDSDNIEKYGVRYGSVYFDSEDNEIYPSIEGMTKEQLNLSNINVSLPKDDNGNLDEILGADNPTDDGLIPDEGKGKIDGQFKIYLKDIGFDLTEKDKDGQYKYQIAGQPVQIAMKSGMCVGREFDVVENGIKKDTSLGYTRYVLELKRFEDDNIKGGTAFPNSAYTISKGDKFVILGIEMPDVYVKSASQKLLVAAQEYLSQNDETKYSYQPTISSNFMARNPHLGESIKEGDIFTFKDDDLQIDASEIIQTLNIEYNLDSNPLPSYKVVLSNDKIASRLDKMQNSINTLVSNGTGITINQVKSLINTIGAAMFLRKDISDETDYLQKFNAGAEFGQYGKKKGAYINEEGIGDFEKVVSKDTDFKEMHAENAIAKVATLNDLTAVLAKIHGLEVSDTAIILKAVVKEYFTSEKFVSGFAGEGFRINQAINGDWNLEIDNLIVRKLFNVFEIVVQKISHQGGMIIRSACGGKITKVIDGGSYWKCEHDGIDDFVKDDQVLCQVFKGDNVKRYWRLATSAGKGYVNLSKADMEANSSIPQVGDEIVQLGNRTNINRQSAQIVSVVGADAPCLDNYAGINSYSLKDKLVTREGNLNGIIDKDFGALKGHGLYANNAYLKGILRLTNGKTVEQEILNTNNTVEANRLELGGEIDKAKADAKVANDKIDGLKIGGVNLADNSLTTKWYAYPTAVVFEYINNYARIPLPLVGGVIEIGCGIISKTDTNTSYSQSLIIRTDGKLNSFKFSFFSSVTSHRYVWAKISQINTNAYYCEATTRTTDEQINTRVGNVHDLKIDGGTYVEFGYPCLVQGEKSMKWTPSLADQQSYTDKQITSVRTDFDVIEGQINANVAKTETLVNQTTGLVEESKQTATQVNQTAVEINQNVKRSEKSATRAETAEANINTKADGIVMEASKQSAEKAIEGLEIGGRNYWAITKEAWHAYLAYQGDGTFTNTTTANAFAIFKMNKLEVPVGETYTVSFEINVSDDAIQFKNGLFYVNETNPNARHNRPTLVKDKWVKVYATFKYTTETTDLVHIYIGYIPSRNSFQIRNFQLEKGTKPTDWTPAPEDIDQQFQATNSKLELLNNQFSVEVAKTDGIRKDLTTLSQDHDSFKIQVKTDIDGAIDSNNEVIKSSFTMNGNKIGLLGSEIDMTGKITFSALDSDTQDALDILAIKVVALGDLAYEDMVSIAKLDNTIIEGGFIKTSLIEANSITADKINVQSLESVRIRTGNLDVLEGATIAGFELGNGRIGVSGKVWDSTMNNGAGGYRPAEPGESGGATDFGNLTIYKDFFKVGGNHGYAMFGNDVIPASAGGAFSAVGRITNKKPNMSGGYGYDRANYGLFIDVEGGTKNYGLKSNAPLIATSFINTTVGELDFNASTYNIDFSQHSIFIMNRSRGGEVTVTMPSEDSVAQHFGMYSMPNGFGFIFTVVAAPGTEKITLLNIKDRNNKSSSFAFNAGDNATILVHKRREVFEYQLLTYNT